MHKIQKYLNEHHITQDSLAALVGIHVTTLRNYIKFRKEPRLSIAVKIQKVTENEITVEDLAEEWECNENKSSA